MVDELKDLQEPNLNLLPGVDPYLHSNEDQPAPIPINPQPKLSPGFSFRYRQR